MAHNPMAPEAPEPARPVLAVVVVKTFSVGGVVPNTAMSVVCDYVRAALDKTLGSAAPGIASDHSLRPNSSWRVI
jgi:hypothetical protein